MHTLRILFAASALAGHALAGPGAISSPDKRGIGSSDGITLLDHGELMRRQSTTSEESGEITNGFPAECQKQCDKYLVMGDECTSLSESSSSSLDSNASAEQQQKILRCACTDEFFAATQACIDCAPESFKTGDDYDGNMILDMAKKQCADSGMEVEDTSGEEKKKKSAASPSAGAVFQQVVAGSFLAVVIGALSFN